MGQYTEKGYQFSQSAPKIQEILETVIAFMRMGGTTAMSTIMEDITALNDKVEECETSAMGIVQKIEFNLLVEKWVKSEDENAKYPFSYTFDADRATIDTIPFVFFGDDSLDDAARFHISANAFTNDGTVTIKSKLKADTNLIGVCYIIGAGGSSGGGMSIPPASANTLGLVMIGNGINADNQGRISVDTAGIADEVVNKSGDKIADEVVSGAVAPDSAVDNMLDEVFGQETQ